jgi:hypothetical protein
MVAIVAMIPVIYNVLQSSSQSGFGKYLSLISSDGSYMLQNWKEFLLSAASSLPITGSIAVLLILFIFANSLRYTVRNSVYSNKIKLRLVNGDR